MPADEPISPAAPGAPGPAAADPCAEGEPEAWAAVLAGWEEEAAHRAYLARCAGLDGLAVAGGRYRAALAERPDDAVAARWRDEVVRRAMAQGLAALPRAAPPAAGHLRRALLVAAVLLLGGMAAWAAVRLATSLAGGAP